MNEINKELEFELELSLTENEINTKVLRIELNDKKSPVLLLIVIKIIIEIFNNEIALSAVAKNLELAARILCSNV